MGSHEKTISLGKTETSHVSIFPIEIDEKDNIHRTPVICWLSLHKDIGWSSNTWRQFLWKKRPNEWGAGIFFGWNYMRYIIYIYISKFNIWELYIYIYENQKLRALWYIKIRNRWDWYMKTMNWYIPNSKYGSLGTGTWKPIKLRAEKCRWIFQSHLCKRRHDM